MPSIESELRAQFNPAIEQLDSLTSQLASQLQVEQDYPIWVWQARDDIASREALVAHVSALDFEDLQAANNTKTCTCLVGASAQTMALVQALNGQRKVVTNLLRRMDDKTVEVDDEQGGRYEKLVKLALNSCGHPRLHRKQIMRPFEILPDAPERVGFTWARIRKSERIHNNDAHIKLKNLLDRAGSESRRSFLKQELQLLAQLDPDEPLTIVTPPHVHARANIVWAIGTAVKRQTRRAVVPIFYPAEAGDRLPLIKPLADEPPPEGHRMKRRDVKIMEEPYLLSIRAHRYIKYAKACA